MGDEDLIHYILEPDGITLDRCGASNPDDPGVTCMLFKGHFLINWHTGVAGPTGRRHLVSWGADYVEWVHYEMDHPRERWIGPE